VEASLHADSINQAVKHWEWLNQGEKDNRVWLHLRSLPLWHRTRDGNTVDLFRERRTGTGNRSLADSDDYLQAQPGKTVTLERW